LELLSDGTAGNPAGTVCADAAGRDLDNPAFAQSNVQKLNTDGIAKAMGKEGELTGDMYSVSFPRSDLTVKVGNVVIKPALALMSWAAFVKSAMTAVAIQPINRRAIVDGKQPHDLRIGGHVHHDDHDRHRYDSIDYIQ
jgi:hypothetical protein